MGSRLSIFKKPVNDIQQKQSSEDKNNEQATEPTPQTKCAQTVNHNQTEELADPHKCACNPCKCDPCHCAKKGQKEGEKTNDTPNEAVASQDQVEVTQNEVTETEKCQCNSCQCDPCSCANADHKQDEKTESAKELVVNESDNKAADEPKQGLEEPNKCSCDQCQCDPCNCASNDHKQEEKTESTTEESVVNDNNEGVKDELVKETTQQSEPLPSENSDSIPQEPTQEVANPSDVS